VGLDPVLGIGIGVVDHLVLADHRIGHDDHTVVARADAGGAQANVDYVAPGADLQVLDPIVVSTGVLVL
jgi:hypothetical protein